MKTKPTKHDVLEQTVAQVEKIWRSHGTELDRLMRIGRCLRAAMKGAGQQGKTSISLYGRHFINKLAERTRSSCGLEMRKVYRCLQLADLQLLSADWTRIKTAGLVWTDIRDMIRLFGRGADRAKVLEAIRAHLPKPKPDLDAGAAYEAWRKSKRGFQAWLEGQINKMNPLAKDARYLVVDRDTGRVYGKRLRSQEAAQTLMAKARRRGTAVAVVKVVDI